MNNPLDDAFSNFNKNYKDYRRTVQDVEREDEQKLKNVTPPKPKNTWHKGKVERVLGKNEELL